MIRRIAEFYLWGMALSFVITLYVGSTTASTTQVFLFAMLSWPLAFFLVIAKRSAGLIRARQAITSAKISNLRGAEQTTSTA